MNKNKPTKKRRRGNAVSQFYWEIGQVYGQVERTKKFIECLEKRLEKIFSTYQNDFDIEPAQLSDMRLFCKMRLDSMSGRFTYLINVLNSLKKNLDKEALSARHKEKDERDPRPVQDEPQSGKPQHLVVG